MRFLRWDKQRALLFGKSLAGAWSGLADEANSAEWPRRLAQARERFIRSPAQSVTGLGVAFWKSDHKVAAKRGYYFSPETSVGSTCL